MRKKKFKKQKSKYADEAVIVEAKVCKIDFLNQEIGNSLKSVFYCPSYYAPEGRMCIYYKKCNIEIGDKISMKGRFNDGVFLVWDMQIKRREINDNQTNNQSI